MSSLNGGSIVARQLPSVIGNVSNDARVTGTSELRALARKSEVAPSIRHNTAARVNVLVMTPLPPWRRVAVLQEQATAAAASGDAGVAAAQTSSRRRARTRPSRRT